MKLAIGGVMSRHNIENRRLAAAIGMEESAVSRALVWELDVVNIGYMAVKLGYVPRGPEDFPTFIRCEGPAPKLETVQRDQVLDLLRTAVRRAGGRSAYAMKAGGVSGCTSGLPAALRGEKDIPTRFLTPLNIKRAAGGGFVREVA